MSNKKQAIEALLASRQDVLERLDKNKAKLLKKKQLIKGKESGTV